MTSNLVKIGSHERVPRAYKVSSILTRSLILPSFLHQEILTITLRKAHPSFRNPNLTRMENHEAQQLTVQYQVQQFERRTRGAHSNDGCHYEEARKNSFLNQKAFNPKYKVYQPLSLVLYCATNTHS